jgi:hypothetical protein
VADQELSWNSFIGGIGGISPTDLWAVGNYQNPIPPSFGNGDLNLAEHWDGNAWSVVDTPNPGSDANDLSDVTAIASNDVWAVGASNSIGSLTAEALHWNGATWSGGSTVAAPGGGQNALNDVTSFAMNDVWAVGTYFGDNGLGVVLRHTLIEHWNGSVWSVSTSPNIGTGANDLFGVGGTSGSDIWAVGYSRATQTAARQALILHYNGSVWSVFTPSSPIGGELSAVAADSTSHAFAVGANDGGNNLPVADIVQFTGSDWTGVSFSEPSVFGEYLSGIAKVSSTEYWAVGAFINSSSNINAPFVPWSGTWNGTSWSFNTSMPAPGTSSVETVTVAAPASGDVWAAGYYSNSQGIAKPLIENFSGLAAPVITGATPGDQAVSVTWSAPCSDGGSAVTSYVVTARDGCTIQGSKTVTGAPPATTVNFDGLPNGNTFSFSVAAVNGFGVGPGSSTMPATPTGATAPNTLSACSPSQYSLTGNNGLTWQPIDSTNLALSFTPSVDSFAILSGNADLFTAKAGFNQDVGLVVSGGAFPTVAGQPEAWKESGGFAGTFSPNAAFVQTVIPVVASTTYTVGLAWKANKPDPGTIYISAGSPGDFSPTRLTIHLIPQSAAMVFAISSQKQYSLTGSNGTSWATMDAASLQEMVSVPAGNWLAIASANVDLFTAKAGFNQDVGIAVSGGVFPTAAGQPEAWKESGGFAGTFSPNAAFVQAPLVVAASTSYQVSLVWKANKPASGATIYAGAGPIGGKFSRTTLTVFLVPNTDETGAANVGQYVQVNSDGTYWQPVDSFNLSTSVMPASTGSFMVAGNADLFTANATYNQDIGIMVSGGAYGPGTLVAWKESGGFAGTLSPNAAFVATELHLQGSITYHIWLVWKANRWAQVFNQIYIGAGPINAKYSPTWLTAVKMFGS